MVCRLKHWVFLGLLSASNLLSVSPCDNSNFVNILTKQVGKNCTSQAAQDAISCLQNNCEANPTIALSNSQLSCFSEGCGGMACALSNNQISANFLNQYNTQAQLCLKHAQTVDNLILQTVSAIPDSSAYFANLKTQLALDLLFLLIYAGLSDPNVFGKTFSVTGSDGVSTQDYVWEIIFSEIENVFGSDGSKNLNDVISVLSEYASNLIGFPQIQFKAAFNNPQIISILEYLVACYSRKSSSVPIIPAGSTPLYNLLNGLNWTPLINDNLFNGSLSHYKLRIQYILENGKLPSYTQFF